MLDFALTAIEFYSIFSYPSFNQFRLQFAHCSVCFLKSSGLRIIYSIYINKSGMLYSYTVDLVALAFLPSGWRKNSCCKAPRTHQWQWIGELQCTQPSQQILIVKFENGETRIVWSIPVGIIQHPDI